jgi:hypothetical protein
LNSVADSRSPSGGGGRRKSALQNVSEVKDLDILRVERGQRRLGFDRVARIDRDLAKIGTSNVPPTWFLTETSAIGSAISPTISASSLPPSPFPV